MSVQIRLFDDEPVEKFSGKFAGAFDVDSEDAESVAHYGTVVMVVMADASDAAQFKRMKDTGNWERVFSFSPQAVRFAKGEMLAKLVHAFDLYPDQPRLAFLDQIVDAEERPLSVDTDTGEIKLSVVPTPPDPRPDPRDRALAAFLSEGQ